MEMYFSDIWIGYLTEQFMRQSVEIAKLRCPGCLDKLKSPLLHQHEQDNLLQKLRANFEEIRGNTLPVLSEHYKRMKDRLPHSDDLAKDEECYMSAARQFLLVATSDALYFGRYISEFTDSLIDEGFVIKKKSQPPKKRGRNTNGPSNC